MQTNQEAAAARAPRVPLTRQRAGGLGVASLRRGRCEEYFVSAVPEEGEGVAAVLAKVAAAVRDRGARIIAQEVLGLSNRGETGLQRLREAFGEVSWPVMWIEDGVGAAFAGTQLWAMTGGELTPVRLGGRLVGNVFTSEGVRYCRMSDVRPTDSGAPRGAQASQAYAQMQAGLKVAGMDFSEVGRTWLYVDRILEWYGELNRARDGFYRAQGVYRGLVPASTGVSGSNGLGVAMIAGLLAVKSAGRPVRVTAVPSPLQCPALQYGSSFSRAVEIEETGCRRLFVSGTASIAAAGQTQHVGQVGAQVERTMAVVEAILTLRGMGWGEVTRAIAYFKDLKEAGAFAAYTEGGGLGEMPVPVIQSDICRDDLLFEIELDAIAGTPG